MTVKRNPAPHRSGLVHPGFLVPLVSGAVLILAFLVVPLVAMVGASFASAPEPLAWYQRALASPYYTKAFGNSLLASLVSMAIGLGVGTLGAAALHSLGGAWKPRVLLLASISSNFSGIPLAFAYIILLGSNGILTLLLFPDFDLYSWAGLGLVYVYFQIPLAILLLVPAFTALKPEWREAARLLGAGPLAYWKDIAGPVLAPAVLGTGGILFANALGAYATAYALVGSNFSLVPIRISSLVAGDVSLQPELGSALAVLLTLLMALAIGLNQALQSRYKGYLR